MDSPGKSLSCPPKDLDAYNAFTQRFYDDLAPRGARVGKIRTNLARAERGICSGHPSLASYSLARPNPAVAPKTWP